MNCKSVQNRLSAYIDRELTGTEMLSVRAHLSVCEMCRIEEDGLRRLKQVLLASPAPEPPADLADRLTAAILSDRKEVRERVPFRVPAFAFAGVAACSMAATFLVISMVQPRESKSPTATARRHSPTGLAFDVQRDQAQMIGSDPTSGVPIISASTYGRQR